MKKRIVKLISVGLTAVMIFSGSTVCMGAELMSSVLPAAGTARILNEGKSVTSLKADQIKTTRGLSTNTQQSQSEAADKVMASLTSSVGDSMVSTSASNTQTGGMTVVSETALKDVTTIQTVAAQASPEPEIMTVGAGSTAGSVDVMNAASNTDAMVRTVNTESAEGSDAEVLNLVDAVTSKNVPEEENFTNLVIAQVTDYVNVRDIPSEDGEVVGKLYNHSAGDLLETDGDWYKIKSGNVTGYVKSEYVETGAEAEHLAKLVGMRMAVVTTTTLYVRSEPSKEAEVIGMVPMEDELQVLDELDGWVKVSVEEGDGFVSSEFVRVYTDFVRAESKAEEEARLAKEEAEREAARKAAEAAQKKRGKTQKGSSSSGGGASYSAPGSSTGSAVANYALQFVGNPYVYGGSSLTNGTDCSGFVMSVYRNFGVSLPHSSGADRSVGYSVGGVANAQPGDIICYSGHVGIYIGNGQIVHASTARTGIKVSNVSYRSVLAVRRIF
jgi:cell wall-associated NlpC family hydrolase